MSIYQSNEKIRVENLKKSFGEISVIDNISFYAKENEFVSILGPSGSGKSTIFNMISGLLKADQGKILIDGEDFTGRLGRVSYMHQKDLLFPWKKIIDNVAISLVVKGEKEHVAREKVKDYFKAFGLEGFENKYPYQLSGGMKQRAALLRTYMFSKDIMLLDEPFGALDAITRSKMHFWLLEMVKELKSTVLFITHDIEEAIFLSDRIYVLSDKPASIKEEIIVDLKNREDKTMVASPEFNNIKKRILNII
ncbi:taurine import ATP-binding protein TauB [Clostridium homopropionicum DSM 5847]|uniref:Taurine import ATP-binding protein TauB n=1 Tax=Clostridium homopropionicum DSM 5847 TaxID=1121318 RepID=A0A0L6Z763_9CLOT|nr:ABC transporter ATP-binding protein [Clostridium homopropionicum]KOA18806.1 taurine import ATP-binding protein TauB [Clostridium homopropionicum DSM 5847]SFG76662.1 ABC-type nitrate/sulfonate/bicarbonate transport system, ATPase component [Clostridium homopropionicum]